MGKHNDTKKQYILWTVRILLTLACIAMVGFIFSNSLKDAQQSSAQSSQVVEVVQQVVSVIAPNSQIANATGEAYDLLHKVVRELAHVLQFFALGALGAWCCCSYTFRKIWQLVPILGIVGISLIDELLQIFSEGRAFEWGDIGKDVLGGILGIALAIFCVWCGYKIYKNAKIKKEKKALLAELAVEQEQKGE